MKRSPFDQEDNLEKDRKPLDYTTALERVNDQLVVTLKYCVKLLTEFKYLTPDPVMIPHDETADGG